ncbi:unnamed protein product [Closterium sp. Naga37s-1]|nr:unnamed protein product [Closterium sp. Naga37s-1]
MARFLVFAVAILLASALVVAHREDSSQRGGGDNGKGGGRWWRPSPLARYETNMRPCIGWAPIRGAAMIDVLSTQTTGTNEIRYGLMVQGVAVPPAKMTIYSTDPCDPLVTSPKILVELSGKCTIAGKFQRDY